MQRIADSHISADEAPTIQVPVAVIIFYGGRLTPESSESVSERSESVLEGEEHGGERQKRWGAKEMGPPQLRRSRRGPAVGEKKRRSWPKAADQ
jgi:hypothetical protein